MVPVGLEERNRRQIRQAKMYFPHGMTAGD